MREVEADEQTGLGGGGGGGTGELGSRSQKIPEDSVRQSGASFPASVLSPAGIRSGGEEVV
jgi:hypothetical protein